jgi:hypothetical protein
MRIPTPYMQKADLSAVDKNKPSECALIRRKQMLESLFVTSQRRRPETSGITELNCRKENVSSADFVQRIDRKYRRILGRSKRIG